MRSEHGSHRTECLAALLIAALLCRCVCRAARSPPPPFGTFRQCLRLGADVTGRDACGPDVRLRFCDAYRPADLAPCCGAAEVDALVYADERARHAAQLFSQLMDRFDCENANSVSWTCQHCEEAYKQWVCAMHLPELQVESPEGTLVSVKPCRYMCRMVEQRCPYFHPSVKDQYAGERVFKCIDPDIPDLESIQNVTSYGPPHRCYCPQHLGAESSGEAECAPRKTLRRGAHRSGVGRPPIPLPLLLAATALHRWAMRTR